MIIDGVIHHGLNTWNPGTSITSPVYMQSINQDQSYMELNNFLCTSNEYDGSGNVGSPSAASFDKKEFPMSEVRSFGGFQGVRVKNTVKELIMRKRRIYKDDQQSEGECPALIALLQGQIGTDGPKEMLTSSPSKIRKLDFDPGYESMETSPEPFFPDCQPNYPQIQLPHATGNLSIPQAFTPELYPNSFWPLASFAEGEPMSFFQWQIQQEEEKLATFTPQMLTSQDDDGDTFLHIAVAQGRRAVAYVLARKMASIAMLDMKEHNGQTALQLSVAANQHLIVQDLLSLGAQINTADRWGRSPLHVCAEKGLNLTLQTIRRAVNDKGQKLDMDEFNYDGLTALHTAVLSHNAVLRDLSSITNLESPEATELMQRRKLLGECVNMLLLMGSSCATKDRKSGRTSLHMASEEANVELLRILLDQPDSLTTVNAKAFNGNSALHLVSAVHGRLAQVDAVKMLMRKGADPSAINLEKEQPSQLVPKGLHGDQVRRILKGKGHHARASPK
ncbi:hypothetical protein DPEC_G00154470 [Dallia pectoralis]|uniref:Uncharacterized protein n=1 Tax=Dallia pectoralis TaxID=75939 RepID=A0ACC2GK37_DALPE|nr:hypothetical protein DPEC_G00154470 [Dallia pectoralis]